MAERRASPQAYSERAAPEGFEAPGDAALLPDLPEEYYTHPHDEFPAQWGLDHNAGFEDFLLWNPKARQWEAVYDSSDCARIVIADERQQYLMEDQRPLTEEARAKVKEELRKLQSR